jgi:peptidoglycan L-alanyl-D-glutamate endopeptidase CwlK
MDAASEARLGLVYPALAAKIRQMADQLASENIYIRVTQGVRTFAEQDQLYTEGRTAPGKVVTNVTGGHSYHNFGLAVDCCPSTDGPDKPFNPDWNESHPSWKRMVEVGESLGLNCGADWAHFKDVPHFQLTGVWPVGEPPQQARDLFAANNLSPVWEAAFTGADRPAETTTSLA